MKKKTKVDNSNMKECVGFAGNYRVTCNGYMEYATPDIDIKYTAYVEGKGCNGVSLLLSCTAKEAKKLGKLLIKAAKLHDKKGKQFAESLGE